MTACNLSLLACLTAAAVACGSTPPSISTSSTATSPRAAARVDLPFGVRVVGHGPAVILVPGLASSADVWNGTVAHLKDRFTCYVLELPGFVGRPAPAVSSASTSFVATMRDGITALIRDRHLDKPILVGHSLGGFIAMDVARSQPGLLGKLVIVDALPFLAAAWNPTATAESMRAGAPAMRKAMLDGDDEAFATRERAMIASMISDPANQKMAFDWVMASDRKTVVDAMIDLLSTDLRPALPSITTPTLVIEAGTGWEQSKEQIVERYREQYSGLRGVKHAVADHARHFVMLDDPAFFDAQLDSFL